MKNINIIVAIFSVLLCLRYADAAACTMGFCTGSLSCCNDVNFGASCYSASTATCANSSLVCLLNDEACGHYCYNPVNAVCCSGVIYPRHISKCAIPTHCQVTPAPTTVPVTTKPGTTKPIPSTKYPTPSPPSHCGNGFYQPASSTCVYAYNVTAFGLGKDGRLGVGKSVLPPSGIAQKPTFVPDINGDSVVSVQTAPGHTALLTYANRLYVTGQNSFGELGLNYTSNPVFSFEYLFFFADKAPVVAYACGLKHTIVVLKDSTVYGFGSNSNGQLGLGTSAKGNHPIPTQITIPGLGSDKIIGTAVGFIHTVIWSTSRVWAFGDAANKQVGNTATFTPRIVYTAPSGDSIASCNAGGYSSFFLLGSGAVLGLGGGSYGLLGTGNMNNIGTPQLLTFPSVANIAYASVSQQHSMFLTNDTKPALYASGLNTCGELGLGTVDNGVNMPTPVTFFDSLNETIQGIASAFAHSIVWTEKNLYVFGCNTQFQLGMPQTGSAPQYAVSTPKVHPFYENNIILTANAKGSYSFIVSESATVVPN